MTYDTNDASTRNLTYALTVGGVMLFEDSTDMHYEAEDEFTVCSKDTDCLDYDGCTADVCNSTLRICENKLSNDTRINCDCFSVKITPDNYPEETTWYLRNYENKDLVLSGDPSRFRHCARKKEEEWEKEKEWP